MSDTRLVAVDGRDALAGVIIRPSPDDPDRCVLDAWANGIGKREAAFYLRHVADLWDRALTAAAPPGAEGEQ